MKIIAVMLEIMPHMYDWTSVAVFLMEFRLCPVASIATLRGPY